MSGTRVAVGTTAAVVTLAMAVLAFPPAPPNDPNYAPAPCPLDPSCTTPTGQWNLFSFTPNFPPTPHASGISADLAWDLGLGRPDTVVAILDSGVNYDHADLRTKIWLNRGELPVPNGACAAPPGDPHDCNGDGGFDVDDYSGDSRLADVILPGYLSRSDLRVFADGADDDGNGFVDDLSGWDADDDDGDEYDHRAFGHGTGRNGFVAAATDNGVGIAGICPRCPVANVRVDDTFVHKTEGAAKGAIWAADHGHSVIVMALGATGAASMTRAAFDYATRRNVLALNASANEFSFHQNFQTVFDDVMAIGAVVPDNELLVTTYLRKANFSNYGAHLEVVTPSDAPTTTQGALGGTGGIGDSSGTSSAVPHAGGVAALVFSRARDLIALGTLDVSGLSLPDISAQEVRQIINRSARDIVTADDPLGPYALAPGWDRFTGYGRVDAHAAVAMVGPATIPPEADVNAPDWYAHVNGTVPVEFYANARWASTFSWTLQVGAGVQPASWTTVGGGVGVGADPGISSADLVSNFSTPWATGALAAGAYTLRLRVTDDLGNLGEDRMTVFVRPPDPSTHPGWPIVLPASVESISTALVDLDDDNRLEVVVSDADGNVHAFRENGTVAPGFPVGTDPVPGLPTCCSPAFDGNPANGEVPITGSSVIGGVAVGDIDDDDVLEICASAYDGRVYCWNADGTPQSGFPVAADPGQTRDPYDGTLTPNAKPEPMLAPPALGDLDGDGTLELIAGGFDQQLYVWNADGTRHAPFPIEVFDAASAAGIDPVAPRAIISVPVVADIDADGVMEMVFGTNETYGTPNVGGQGGSGRLYAYDANGNLESGWPVPIASISPDAVPLVAEGIGTSPAAADLDGDGTLEIAAGLLFGDATIFNHDGTTFSTMSGALAGTGAGGDGNEETPEGGLGKPTDGPVRSYTGHGSFADVDADGVPDYLAGTVGIGIATVALSSGAALPFDHYLSAWNALTGLHKPAFPRVVEDWQFFTSPSVADLDGAAGGLPEMIVSSGGWFVHAFNALGVEPAGWPKFTGQWVVTTPAVGDVDDDGALEVAVATRLGSVYLWDQPGNACNGDRGWRKFHHDEWNSGVLGRDTRRPARPTDLAATTSGGGVTIRFIAVGDDGRCGTAHEYRLFSSASPITLATLASATPLAVPAPAPGGSAEALVVTPPNGHLFFALQVVDEAGNRSPLASIGFFDLRRLKLRRLGPGRDRLVAKGEVLGTVSDLGLVGEDIGFTLADTDTTIFSATIPGALIEPNPIATRLRFSDKTGTLAGGLTKLVLKETTKGTVRVRLKARDVTLIDPDAGAFTATLSIGTLGLEKRGTLRAKGASLLFP